MTLYTGSTRDGSDMKEVGGMYLSPDGNQWSSEPYPIWNELIEHMEKNNLTVSELHDLIINRKSGLSRSRRNYFLMVYKKDEDS